MILTDDIRDQIVAAIEGDRSQPVTLPAWAYTTKPGRVVVLVDGLPIDLHRHLHDILIRPLGYHELMYNMSVEGNINPYLFDVREDNRSRATHCPKGHEYAGNEMPRNSRGYRCRTCYGNSRPRKGGSNADKTECPKGHEYTTENTYMAPGNRRRCRECKKAQGLAYVRRVRSSKPESDQN